MELATKLQVRNGRDKASADNDDLKGIVEAIHRSQAVISFNLDGTIIEANDNFLGAVGYALGEIKGKHHSMFCDPQYASSSEYKAFWQKLNRGEFDSGEYKRLGKGGKEIWIQASYNPILDDSGKPYKVVKFASDITEMKKLSNLAQGLDLAPVNIMMADPQGKLTYLNRKTRETLKSLESKLPAKVDTLLGKSIDIFHKQPEHQRNIIKDPKNLPMKSVIDFAGQKLDLLVSPVYDIAGEFIGPMVCWDVITAKVELVETLEKTSNELAGSAEELLSVSASMKSNSEETSAQSANASTGSEQVSAGINTVVTNIEEMTASIKEITKATNESSTMSNSAMKMAHEANGVIKQLGDASLEIGNVIKVISAIAQQTNLLALNATIEAARAGEAGKGFAVVANEVKDLAKETAKATADITKKIENIQGNSKSAVDSIDQVTGAIEKLNEIASSIAASVEEQAASTNEVNRVVTDSARAVQSITENIGQVSQAAAQTSEGAIQTNDSAKALGELAERLKDLVKRVQV